MTSSIAALSLACVLLSNPAASPQATRQTIDLPSSKQITEPVPGNPQRLSSLPVSMAVSPDKRWIVTVNGGYGSAMSDYDQSLAVLNTQTGKLQEFPDGRTGLHANQVLFSGLSFSADGKHLYASMASLTDPEGKSANSTGSGVAVYTFAEGVIAPERILPLPLVPLAHGRSTRLGTDPHVGVPYPAAISDIAPDSGRPEELLVADNLSDSAVLLNAQTGAVVRRFDLSESASIPGTFPAAVTVTPDGRRGFVALSNASEAVELDLGRGKVLHKLTLLKPSSPVAPGSHPSALLLSPDGNTLYVALANRDSIAAVDVAHRHFKLKGYLDVRLPGQSFYGAQPEALATNEQGSQLFCANMGSNAVAVFSTAALTSARARHGMVEPAGFIPTEWLPMAVTSANGKLYIATGKGTGTGPNNFPQQMSAANSQHSVHRSFTYIATLLHGSLAIVDRAAAQAELKQLTAETLANNRMERAQQKIAFNPAFAADGGPIHHVVYIIRENRTYDQILGDLQQNGKHVGNGDPSLTMYGESITPNIHKLALQFGVLDNFFDSAEVSGDGHVWSNTAIGTDYLERTWQDSYRGKQRTYDYEGVVADGIPLAQNLPDVNEPASGYIWGDLAAHGKTLYHFGEYISSIFCNPKGRAGAQDDPSLGPMREGELCSPRSVVKPGDRLPAEWGGEVNRYPWAIPLLGKNIATKPELVGHFAPEYPDFNLKIPDQVRVDIFLRHLKQWEADLNAGRDTMPNFVMLRLPNDHTAGTTPGSPTPAASIADNDLAVGRAVEAISHSRFWDSTAFFILEDDAQNGADHVDAHRSLGLVISKYAPHGSDGSPFVDSRFYSTVSMVRTIEAALGLPPMNNNDALSSMIGSLFTGPGDQPAFTADTRNRDNDLIYTANTPHSPGAKDSARMDFSHADRADSGKLNVILWRDAMGTRPVPSMLTQKHTGAKHDDDDD